MADKLVEVIVQPGRSLVAQPQSGVKTRVVGQIGIKIEDGKQVPIYDERTVAVDMVRHGPGSVLKLPEKEAALLIERGFVKAA